MQVVAIDSYGKCLHNKDFPENPETAFSSVKIPLFAGYKFALSLENSFATDYVTEKFYQPLIAGSVPIYLGAPNVEEFAPSPHSFIDLRRFATAQELGGYLKYLNSNQTAYEEFHEWRRKPFIESFKKQAELAFNQGSFYGEQDMRQDPCRICSFAQNLKNQRVH
mmetsp:Transcript_13720/g.21425  ORF Transcript_13720/g.21425 Transcript_13720/m.21425 type:complete len:165 (-) Transcript_13720:28-522(-)|eukprot:CAMPEP_0184294578 /NCGR_PEP_ID=MMETSP1049-20130417/5732_1 /TAXON_ID=77928 /ORGANISM="Proteomonas sulcata, Strain CCMP704" /LENGTH=164 /DNA_ID=CAMNT_0026602911 /DNA_START=181 /DNA_END=675 /DNA_ORIENTATION=-